MKPLIHIAPVSLEAVADPGGFGFTVTTVDGSDATLVVVTEAAAAYGAGCEHRACQARAAVALARQAGTAYLTGQAVSRVRRGEVRA